MLFVLQPFLLLLLSGSEGYIDPSHVVFPPPIPPWGSPSTSFPPSAPPCLSNVTVLPDRAAALVAALANDISLAILFPGRCAPRNLSMVFDSICLTYLHVVLRSFGIWHPIVSVEAIQTHAEDLDRGVAAVCQAIRVSRKPSPYVAAEVLAQRRFLSRGGFCQGEVFAA